MNTSPPDLSPNDPELRITALLLGELTPAEEAELRAALERDPELARLHARLQSTVALVREVESRPENAPVAQSAPQRLSEPRRQRLLQLFKIVPSPRLRPDAASPNWNPQRWLMPLGLAAALVILASLSLPNFARARHTAALSAAANNRRILEGAKEQWALESHKSPNDVVAVEELGRYLKGAPINSTAAGKKFAGNAFGPVEIQVSGKADQQAFAQGAGTDSVAQPANAAQPSEQLLTRYAIRNTAPVPAATPPTRPVDREPFSLKGVESPAITTPNPRAATTGAAPTRHSIYLPSSAEIEGPQGTATSGQAGERYAGALEGKSALAPDRGLAPTTVGGADTPSSGFIADGRMGGVGGGGGFGGGVVAPPEQRLFFGDAKARAEAPAVANNAIVANRTDFFYQGNGVQYGAFAENGTLGANAAAGHAAGQKPQGSTVFDYDNAGGLDLPPAGGAAVAQLPVLGDEPAAGVLFKNSAGRRSGGGAAPAMDALDVKLPAPAPAGTPAEAPAVAAAVVAPAPTPALAVPGQAAPAMAENLSPTLAGTAAGGVYNLSVARYAAQQPEAIDKLESLALADARQQSPAATDDNAVALGFGLVKSDAAQLPATKADNEVTRERLAEEAGKAKLYTLPPSAPAPSAPAKDQGVREELRRSLARLDTVSAGVELKPDSSSTSSEARLRQKVELEREVDSQRKVRDAFKTRTLQDVADAALPKSGVLEMADSAATQTPQTSTLGRAAKEKQVKKLAAAEKALADLQKENGETQTELAAVAPLVQEEEKVVSRPIAPAPVAQPEIVTADNPFSTFSLNVSDVSFKLAAFSIEHGALPDPGSIRTEEFINAFDYHDPEPAPGMPIAFAWERAHDPFAHNRDLLRFSLQTAARGREPGRPLNLVLLLDSSGSMERADRVSIIHEALQVLAGQLKPGDTISVVAFARTARLWIDGLPGSQAAELVQRVGNLTPEGGTNLEDAMNLAYQTAARHYLANGVNRVVLLTDGAANLGDVDPDSLKQKVESNRKQGIALDCFGIGWEGYNDDLLEVLSRNGDGRYGFVNSPEEAATGFANQLAGALQVAAADVKVQVEFNPARVTAYRQIGYAKHQLTKEQFRDNTVDAAELGAAEAGNALYSIQANPQGEGPIGIVRVRYKVPATGEYREHSWEVPYQGDAPALDLSSPTMRLAGAAAAFAESLAASPFAAEVTPDRLLGLLAGVPESFGADPRPKKLEWMIRQVQSIRGK